jgi:hypothetical protein
LPKRNKIDRQPLKMLRNRRVFSMIAESGPWIALREASNATDATAPWQTNELTSFQARRLNLAPESPGAMLGCPPN